jgi:Tfp pilus assembly PilM family ATPase
VGGEDLRKAARVQIEAEGNGAENAAFDCVEVARSKDKVHVLAVLLPREFADRSVKALAAVRCPLTGLDLDVAALFNALEFLGYAGRPGVAALDIGVESTRFHVFGPTGPVFSRSLPWGGGLVTQSLSRAFLCDRGAAQELKAHPEGRRAEGDPEGVAAQVAAVVRPRVMALIEEVGKTLDYYEYQLAGTPVETIVLVGADACLGCDASLLSEDLGIDLVPAKAGDRLKVKDGVPFDAAVHASALGAALAVLWHGETRPDSA